MKINPSQWRALSVLKAYGTMSVSEIVDHTLMEQPTVSRVVAQLEQDGLVQRNASTEDSRVTEVVLTETGIAAFEAIAPAALRHQELALQGLTKKEIKTFVDILARIEQNIEI
nr:MarR family transcriptional regulator [Govania unica]